MRINKLNGAILASVLVLSVGTIAVKAAPISEKQKVITTKKTTGTKNSTESTSVDATTVTPTVPAKEETVSGNEENVAVTPTIVSSTKYKEVTMITKEDIQKMVGVDVTYKNVSSIYKVFKQSSTWEKAGYNENDAKLIVSRITANYKQTVGILKKIAKNNELGLKVVLIHKPNYQSAYIGVIKTSSEPDVNNTALKELEITAKYKGGSVELEYSIKEDGSVKAEYENDFTKEELKGKVAQAKVEAILEGLNINEKNQEAIVTYILEKLELDKDYKKFEFEAKFNNGSKYEFQL